MTCTDFSLFNKSRKGVLGKSGVVLLNFLYELRWRRYDVVLIECVPQLDMAFLRKHVAEMYDIDTLVWGPERAGWTCARPRLFVVMTAKTGKVVLAKQLEEFAKIMGKPQPQDLLARSMWWCAGADDIQTALLEALNFRACAFKIRWLSGNGPRELSFISWYKACVFP